MNLWRKSDSVLNFLISSYTQISLTSTHSCLTECYLNPFFQATHRLFSLSLTTHKTEPQFKFSKILLSRSGQFLVQNFPSSSSPSYTYPFIAFIVIVVVVVVASCSCLLVYTLLYICAALRVWKVGGRVNNFR